MRTSRSSPAGLCAAASLLFATAAQAQTYPAKPIHIVVAQAAGGGMDTLARLSGSR